ILGRCCRHFLALRHSGSLGFSAGFLPQDGPPGLSLSSPPAPESFRACLSGSEPSCSFALLAICWLLLFFSHGRGLDGLQSCWQCSASHSRGGPGFTSVACGVRQSPSKLITPSFAPAHTRSRGIRSIRACSWRCWPPRSLEVPCLACSGLG